MVKLMPLMLKMEIRKEKFKIENRRYLGSKAKLIPFIKKIVLENCSDIHSVTDIFAGIGNVAMAFNNKGTKVIVNDLLYSNNVSYVAWFGKEKIDFQKMTEYLHQYNSINNLEENYFSKNFANTYFSEFNCKKIGYIREDIENKFDNGEINNREKCYLITSLIYAMDHIANTVGHYDAFRLHGDLDKKLILKDLEVPENGINNNNEIYRMDSNKLASLIETDLVYIDPPYNSRQYCDSYHLLENIAEWKKPRVYGIAKKMDRSSEIKSNYCTLKAPIVFDNLIRDLKCKYILVSYNNTGLTGAGRSQAKISDNDIISSLSKKGKVLIFSTDYKQFTTGKTKVSDHQERLFLCIVGKQDTKCTYNINSDIKYAKSPLNYTGGKFKLLSQLEERFPKKFNCFVDLFGGGYNVGVNLGGTKCICNDRQKEVIKILKLLYKYNSYDIEKKIETIINEYGLSNSMLNGYSFYNCSSDKGLGPFNKVKYEKLREKYNSFTNESEEKYFYLLTLIIFAFNNQIRFNSKGQYNMPVGKRDFNNSIRKNLDAFCSKMHKQEIIFYTKDFRKMESLIPDGSFVYCDPPYFLGTASYNENAGWTRKDDIDLMQMLINIDRKGIKFALSNVIEHKGLKNQPLLDWATENHFNINYLRAKYDNSNYHIKDKNYKTIEVLITNY